MNIALNAMLFARMVHAGQKRKYTEAPYAYHLAEVAGIVATVDSSWRSIATAWLHDCVEDQNVKPELLVEKFGGQVAEGVMWLSDLEEGNRAARKKKSCERLSKAPAWIQTIKCADLISNTTSIVQRDPAFAVTYLREKRALLKVLTLAHPDLRKVAVELANAWDKP